MKKLPIIFSLILVATSSCGFPFQAELNLLLKRYLHSAKRPSTTNRDTQMYIDEHKKELFAYFASKFNLVEPLPFVSCTQPAFFDVLKSHANKDLFDQALSNLYFNPCAIIDTRTNANVFHVCSKAGTNKYLKRILYHCKQHGINYSKLLNTKDNNGMTPLGLAAQFSRTKCLSLLLDHGARISAQSGSLIHFAATANMRGERKRNAVIERLCQYDEELATTVNSDKKGAEVLAGFYTFDSTKQLILAKKEALLKQLHEEKSMYFKCLPEEIYHTTLTMAYGLQAGDSHEK